MMKSRIEKLSIHSKYLNKKMQMLIYLPSCYEEKTKLPVLYFFHGRSGNENILIQLNLKSLMDEMISSKEVEPMIIVCPNMDNSRGINSSTDYREVKSSNGYTINLGLYEDFFIKEVVPLIEKTYKTINSKSGRYIGGVSSGGYTALHNAFRHQHMFSKVGGHMPAVELVLEEQDIPYFKDEQTFKKYDPINIAKQNDISQNIKVYLDAGNKDEGHFFKGIEILHDILIKKGVNSEKYVFKGNHSVEYIVENIRKYLKFYGN